MKNKFGVEYHQYEIVLANGDVRTIDVECVGWGNDSDGHIEIISVIDIENNNRSMNPLEWAENHVWIYVDNYSC